MRSWITRRAEVIRIVGTWLACLTMLCGIWLASILYFLDNARHANAIRLAANQIRIQELGARRAEKDFLLRSLADHDFFHSGHSDYLKKHRDHVRTLRREIERLSGQVRPPQNARIRVLLKSVDRYESGFENLVAAHRERGFDRWGVVGALDRAVRKLEHAVQKRQSAALERALLRLERDEQSYFLYRSPPAAARLRDDLAALRRGAQNEADPAAGNDVLNAVEAYEAAFVTLLDLEERIGGSEELGLQGEFRAAIHAVEPVVEEILAAAVRADELANRTLMIGLLATCFLMAVLLALAIFFAQVARLHNKRLVQANRQMEAEHRKLLQAERLAAIGQMVTGLAHESRNAFQRTHACLDMLSQEVKNRPAALDLVARIEESQDHLHLLYEQVREYAAPLQVKRQSMRLEEVVRSAWERLDLVRAGRDVVFEQHVDQVDLCCDIDGFAMEQVFRNIFENALSACPDPIRIDVYYRDGKVASGPALVISVADNGPGLDAEQRSRIFDPFYTTKIRGTGLGMAIAKRLVEAHGGAIEVGSPARGGAAIVVTLPRQT